MPVHTVGEVDESGVQRCVRCRVKVPKIPRGGHHSAGTHLRPDRVHRGVRLARTDWLIVSDPPDSELCNQG